MTSLPSDTPVQPVFSAPARTTETPSSLPFTFTGSGGEYFRIWIINLLLSIVTLGIYSAWAKIRRLKYVYNHTSVNGSSFEYHGKPLAILKGRIIALILFGGYNIAFQVSPLIGLIAFGILVVVLPWLLWSSFRFRLHNSSYCGIRFGFHGRLSGSYKVFLGIPFLLSIAMMISLLVVTIATVFALAGTEGLDKLKNIPWMEDTSISSSHDADTQDDLTAADEEDETEYDETYEDSLEDEIDDEQLLADLMAEEDDEITEEFECTPAQTTDSSDTKDFLKNSGKIIAPLIIMPIAFIVLIALFYAAVHFYAKRYQHGNSHFGTASSGFYGKMGGFIKAYIVTFIVGGICFGITIAAITGALHLTDISSQRSKISLILASLAPAVAYLLAIVVAVPIWTALIQNTTWNNTRLEQHQFVSRAPIMKMIWVSLTNLIGIICTLGLFFPFAHIRMLKVRLGAMTLIPAGPLDTFISAAQSEVGAVGVGATDFFDFDIGL